MEWKPYYAAELCRAGCRERIVNWLQAAGENDKRLAMIGKRTVLSFPHTAVDYSGQLQARVAAWLVQNGFRRVITLGVVHGSLNPVYRMAADDALPYARRLASIVQVTGAFTPTAESLETPFGSLAVGRLSAAAPWGVRPDISGLLNNEFSLDTFHAILRLATDVFQVSPLSVFPVYVGMLRHPISGSFEAAATLASWLRNQWDDSTAIVTTGDVVHYGDVYGSNAEGPAFNHLGAHFRQRLDDLHATAFVERDLETAYQMSVQELKSDHREILPLIVRLLGEDARAELLTFELSDYAAILDTVTPCLVASALIAYKTGTSRV